MKPKRKTSITKKIKPLFSLRVRLRDGKCLRCGKTEQLQCSHILSVGAYKNMEFDFDNAITLCYRCHIHWWHRDPKEATEWLESLFPGRWDMLYERARTMPKRDLQEIYEMMKI